MEISGEGSDQGCSPEQAGLKSPPDLLKCLTAEQIQNYYVRAGNLHEATRYLADLVGIQDFITDAQGAIHVDYRCGILSFAQESGFTARQAVLVYSTGIDLLEVVTGRGTFHQAKVVLKDRLRTLCTTRSSPDTPLLFSTIDLKRVADYFTTTLFQHYAISLFCFTRQQDYLPIQESVAIETAENLPPLADALSETELADYKAVQMAAAAAVEMEVRVKAEAAAAAEAEASAAAEALRLDEERRRKPQSLAEAVDFAVRERLAQERVVIEEDYRKREEQLLEKIQRLEMQLRA